MGAIKELCKHSVKRIVMTKTPKHHLILIKLKVLLMVTNICVVIICSISKVSTFYLYSAKINNNLIEKSGNTEKTTLYKPHSSDSKLLSYTGK